MNHSTTDTGLRTVNAEVGLLREALAESAYGITPSHPPLAAIERDGRRIRRRRRAALLGAVSGLLLVPAAVVASLSPAHLPASAGGLAKLLVERVSSGARG